MRPLWALNLSLRYDHVTGQQVLFFNSFHLNTAWMSNIKDVPMVIVLHYHFSWYRARLSDCDKISSLPVFYVDGKFTHQVIYFNIKLSIFYVKVKIYTSGLLHCYQMPIFKLESTYLVNKPLQAAGMSADNVRGWEIVRKMNIWPRREASRANVKFWGQSLSQGHYQPTYQQARKGFIYFITLPLIFISQN